MTVINPPSSGTLIAVNANGGASPAYGAKFANVAGRTPLRFYLDGSGLVHIEGASQNVSGAATVAGDLLFGALPTGYFPPGTDFYFSGAQGNSAFVAECWIDHTTGNVKVNTAIAASQFLDLSVILRPV